MPPRLRLAALLAVAAGLAFAAAPTAALEEGERVVITGIVTNAKGEPLSGLDVTLVARRETFRLRTFRRETAADARRTARTNDRGEYALEWPWSGYYNRFDLEVGLTVRKPGGEVIETLLREDVSRRLRGTTAVIPLTMADTRFIDGYRAFLATLDSTDERRVFDAMGAPDRIDERVSPTSTESTWMFFPAGRSFIFRDGRLIQEIPFTPVPGPTNPPPR